MTTSIEVGGVYKLKEDQLMYPYSNFTRILGLKGRQVIVYKVVDDLCVVGNVYEKNKEPKSYYELQYYTKTSNLE